jgi:hypothetical protein
MDPTSQAATGPQRKERSRAACRHRGRFAIYSADFPHVFGRPSKADPPAVPLDPEPEPSRAVVARVASPVGWRKRPGAQLICRSVVAAANPRLPRSPRRSKR